MPAGLSIEGGADDRALFFTQDFAEFLQAGGESAGRSFGDFPPPGPFDDIFMSLPKGKARLQMMLECIAASLSENGRLWLAGENRAGIRSAAKPLKNLFRTVNVLDKARHCVLYEARNPAMDTEFDARDYRQSWVVEKYGTDLSVHSWPGVFAHGRLDGGTELLLDHMDAVKQAGRILDFACGAGVIGALLKQRMPDAHLVCSDSDALALRSTRETLEANGLSGQVLASDGFSHVEGQFDLVVSNPPFHSGIEVRSGHGMGLLSPVRNFLAPGGQLLVVVNRHLPYRNWLDELFGRHRLVAANERYHVLQAVMAGE